MLEQFNLSRELASRASDIVGALYDNPGKSLLGLVAVAGGLYALFGGSLPFNE